MRGPAPLGADVLLNGANDNEFERDERSVTVAVAAIQLGCDPSTVRALLRKGLLSGHRVGKSAPPKGVRVKMWSIRNYEAQHSLHAARQLLPTAAPPLKSGRVRNEADDDAHARLKALGA